MTAADEPLNDWTKHISHTHADRKGEAWCGVRLQVFDWAFGDVDHAAYNMQQEGRLLPCPQCVGAVMTAFGRASQAARSSAPAAPEGWVPIPRELLTISGLLKTQDNRITESPLFAVQQKRRIGNIEAGEGDGVVWLDGEGCGYEEGSEEYATADAAYDHGYGEAPKGWWRTGYRDQWEFVTCCFTEQGCKDYLALNGHNLHEPRIYAYGSHRNGEWQFIRKWLMSLDAAPQPPADSEQAPALDQKRINRVADDLWLHYPDRSVVRLMTLTECREFVGSAIAAYAPQPEPTAAKEGARETALSRFNELVVAGEDPDMDANPVERLRAFCSLAMNGQDWLDVEPFFDALVAPEPATPLAGQS
jgi:hypothetical protein